MPGEEIRHELAPEETTALIPWKERLLLGLLGWLGPWIIHLLWVTVRKRFAGRENVDQFYRNGRPCIVAFWHNRILFMGYAFWGGMPGYALISQHRDGEIIARIIRGFGIGSIRGSTTRGGMRALKEMLRALRAGAIIGFTPDGPKGPRYVVQPGVIALAKLSKVPIIPAVFAANREKRLRSWDEFRIPFPFSRGVMMFGEPFYVPADLDDLGFERERLRLEQVMKDLNEQVEAELKRADDG